MSPILNLGGFNITYQIDEVSRTVGIMECFNEMLSCGVKNLALGVPVYDKQKRDLFIDFAKNICNRHGTQFYIEDEGFITDLFPFSMNLRKYNIVFYREDIFLNKYLMLKSKKEELINSNRYDSKNRESIAYEFGQLLSYKEDAIFRMIKDNKEKEVIESKVMNFDVESQITFLYFDDIEKALEFFQTTFGFKIYKSQGADYCLILKTSNSSFLGLVNRKNGSIKAHYRDGALVSFVVNNCEQVYESLKARNVSYISDFKINKNIGIKGFMFTGPEGYRFEVEEFI